MTARGRSLRRLAALQGKVADLAALKLARAEAERSALAAERTALSELMDRADVTGRLALLALERTRTLLSAEGAAEVRQAERLEERRRAETRHRLAERASEAAAREDAAAAERRALERLIEEGAGRDEQAGGGA